MQQDTDHRHSINSTTERLRKKRVKVLQWPSRSPDLNLNKMLWRDFKRAVHKRMPAHFNKLKQCWLKLIHNDVKD